MRERNKWRKTQICLVRVTTGPRLPRTFAVWGLNISSPRKTLSPRQTSTFRHPMIEILLTYIETTEHSMTEIALT